METIHLQCGSCNNMMAIGVEHLGGRVQCPHCQSILQTPPAPEKAPPPGPDPVTENVPNFNLPERESIFTKPDDGDELMQDSDRSRVEMPDESGSNGNVLHDSATGLDSSAGSQNEATEEMKSFKSYKAPDSKSVLVPTLLIFLIPYSIFVTIVCIFLFVKMPSIHNLEYLPDMDQREKPKKGAKRVETTTPANWPKHDKDLPKTLLTTLNEPLTVGDLQWTPLSVRRGEGGDIVLTLKAKNLSKEWSIKPISENFVDMQHRSYSFLQVPGSTQKFYGGRLSYLKSDGTSARANAFLEPDEEELIDITSPDVFRDKSAMALSQSEPILWRLNVRRGYVKFRDQDISATAVIGVSFTPEQVKS